MSGEEQRYINEAFDSNWIAPLGPNVVSFEESLRGYINNEMDVAVFSSGTASIHLSLMLLGVGKEDEVLCQSFSFCASSNPIIYLGATPIFVDSESGTWNMSPLLLEKAIKDRLKKGKKPKAIIAVNLYGMPYMIDEINCIAQKYGIPVVEDSAEALGSEYKNEKCGSFGDLGILSFNGNKIITCSMGGAIIFKNSKLKEKAIFYATQARDFAPHYQHSEIGYNYRMSNILAGIGRAQMNVLEDRIKAKRGIYNTYKKELEKYSNISFLEEPKGFYSNRWLTCILTDSYETRESIRLALELDNIESRPLWKPLHKQPVFESYPSYVDGTSEDLFDRGLCLPSGSNLSKEDQQRIIDKIKSVLK
ncbi:MAG: DegT/DnrJ/EryC1/StrS family aminotransferase [Cellulophaga sp.]|uniref:DegT/DnrJ/EryC1/StrS family aminotransferase n=1 Tax=unclassified Cellulophaga TaxID=2634405 RepID=UPI0026E48EF4|nr:MULTISPECIES: DegT/DnrJ/EryC1/StrS family aminotransferase [unclassified Cellulophaga]MDO6491487.1 DegT/DnrJ/EryC1/StrS family aminotransferase [Cellulophaga sp. 2_MG-2023]MDO6493364.1 DegT/DnrJ/EryC1/StrS family aminotransferase [Cellulophaga sp. 3_MG-2023]